MTKRIIERKSGKVIVTTGEQVTCFNSQDWRTAADMILLLQEQLVAAQASIGMLEDTIRLLRATLDVTDGEVI